MSFKKIKPLGNRLLVKRAEAPETKGSILLPESAQEKPKQGEVVSIGPGKTEEDGNVLPMDVKVGDRVFFSSYAGTKVKTELEDEEYLIMSEDDILAVIN